MVRCFLLLAGMLCLAAARAGSPVDRAPAQAALWAALKGGKHVVLLRHAQTVPGIGDPPGFKLEDCSTQRGLDEAGRAQARAWGKAFARHGIPVGGVYSSAWCRCLETARIAFGRVDSWPALNSHFETPQFASTQAAQVRGGIAPRMQPGKNLVLVTHQVNIAALSDRSPAMGEAVLLRVEGNALQAVGRLTVE